MVVGKHIDLIIKEVNYAIKMMSEHETFEEKLFYFSSIFGMIQRVYNIEYDEDLIYAHFILRSTYEMFQARLKAIKSGEGIIPIFEDHPKKLLQYTKELLKNLKGGNELTPTLKKFITLGYTTTGNGYYLYKKGLIKL
ncbi:MAG: hypothetical protein JW882_09145 [Deltaproteobacteria bacterium]|nr:hypothetical protein [Deltaproteobacteria bacterium]